MHLIAAWLQTEYGRWRSVLAGVVIWLDHRTVLNKQRIRGLVKWVAYLAMIYSVNSARASYC